MVQKAGSDGKKTNLYELAKLLQNETAGNEQMQGYRQVRPHAIKRMNVISEKLAYTRHFVESSSRNSPHFHLFSQN